MSAECKPPVVFAGVLLSSVVNPGFGIVLHIVQPAGLFTCHRMQEYDLTFMLSLALGGNYLLT